MQKFQYKFLKTLCRVYDGENYVTRDELLKAWKKCPEHRVILSLGKDLYFLADYPPAQAYIPTAEGMAFVDTQRKANITLWVSVATLIVAVLTLAATLL